ncbi:MAG: cell division protein FtsZ [Alistipes sp.]|jgi:cell division protein FtsZ|nr:cell division protein FtsZ [Alistipes sp.]
MNGIMKGLALDDVTRSIIMVAGVGGAGGNALGHMIDLGINDVTFMVCNTDAQALDDSRAGIKVQLGSGLGAGNDPEKGSQAAKESIDDIIGVLRSEGTKMLFITAGMGGGTGTGASPIIARAAQELDILTVAIVTTPFTNEGPVRAEQARRGIEELRQYTDSLLVLSNDSIEQLYPDLPYDEGFWRADDVLATAVKGIAEIITGHGTVNVDFADVNTVMRGSGRAFMGSGRAEGENRAMDAVEASVTSLLLNHRDIKGAKNILLNISYGNRTVTQREAGSIRNYLQESTGWTANLIWGTAHKPALEGELELTIVATGFPGGADDVVSVPPPVPGRNAGGGFGVEHGGHGGYGPGDMGSVAHGTGTRYMPEPDIVRPLPDRPEYEPAKPHVTVRGGTTVAPPQSATVQWKGTDRYLNIEHLAATPAWVRHKVTLENPHEGRHSSSKTALEKEAPKEPITGTLFDEAVD